MLLTSLSLKHFRIHRDTVVHFSNGINYIIGGNGHGKTTLLEACYYLCTTKNYKAAPDSELLSFGELSYEITGSFVDRTASAIRIFFSSELNKKSFLVNGKQPLRAADVIASYPVVLLTPADHELTQGYAAARRKFADGVIAQSHEPYLSVLSDFNRTLKQRAMLLHQLKHTPVNNLFSELDAWDEKLFLGAKEIVFYRERFISEFRSYLANAFEAIMGSGEEPDAVYQKFCGDEFSESSFYAELRSLRREEIKRSVNLFGPHRDDFLFTLNGKPLKRFGSQGQQKTFQVALRFAQFAYLKECLGTAPVFLLDDVFGELDAERSRKISDSLRTTGQALITLTDFSNHSYLHKYENDSLIYINRGSVA